MSIAKHHAEWLSLLEISGPFLTLNALGRVFPQGVDIIEPARANGLRAAYNEWEEDNDDPRIHRQWMLYIMKTLLGWDDSVIAEGQGIPDPFSYTAIEHGGETIRPSFILHEPNQPNQVRLLVTAYEPGVSLEKPMSKRLWAVSPAARMLSLLHATGVQIGLVTNGEQWMLVSASKSGMAGFISWYADLWVEERLTLRAFVTLFEARRFFGVAEEDTLEAILDQSADDAQEVTDQLGLQVRHAVEILVRSLDRADGDLRGALLDGVSEAQLYEAALTVMMRLVFLLSAEERGLFLLGDEIYDQNYAISTLRAQLHEAADKTGEQVLERRSDAWSRLLATFRLVYYGANHQDLKLPAYGGSLFDPNRFPFLEGQNIGMPPAIDNRTVLHLLDALQILQMRGEARRLSFRALDIEQIGHVYEGLLDHEARRADTIMLGFDGKLEPEISLDELAAQKDIASFLKDATGRSSVSPINNALRRPPDGDRLRVLLEHSCQGDRALFDQIRPHLNLLRDDEFGHPVVVHPGSVYVGAGAERRSTGTHYTPRSLTEPVVEHTLEPLVYIGVVEGWSQEEWQLRPPHEILELKICDMAMGSGAFLVQACRYLAARILEGWERILEAAQDPIPRLTIEGNDPSGVLTEILIPEDPTERETLALRLVADRCLYGVDKNPLAVEMAKLSLWLTTLAKGRPFTFLDHALKCGDSLVGANIEQLRYWKLHPERDSDGKITDTEAFTGRYLKPIIDYAIEQRGELEAFTVNTVDDQRQKEYLFGQAEATTAILKTAADHLIAEEMGLKGKQSILNDVIALFKDLEAKDDPMETVKYVDLPWADALEGLLPFHWELEFPEVFIRERGGFDAFVGNPPFQGGSNITGEHGTPYRNYLVESIANGKRGNADLSAYFFLRAYDHLRRNGTFGLIATNTIAQGDTRDVGLVQLYEAKATFYHAQNNLPWMGVAAVVVDVVHTYKGHYQGVICLDNQVVDFISPLLDDIAVDGKYLPYHLLANQGYSFTGSKVYGEGFVLEPREAQALIDRDIHNAEVLFPYLNAEDLNSQPDQSPTRWVINFFEWDLIKAEQYPEILRIVREKVKPYRDTVNQQHTRENWWQYERLRTPLYRTIAPFSRVLVTPIVSKYVSFVFQPTDIVYAHRLAIFAYSSSHFFATLQSFIHESWARKFSSTLETRINYSPSDCFETFPFPSAHTLPALESIGEQYHEMRRQIMLNRWEGLTDTYNRFHDPQERSNDIAALRTLHVQMDKAVATAYGWDDLALDHDFHDTAQGLRFTISDVARREVLRRLLALNFERYEEEQRQASTGLPMKLRKKNAAPPSTIMDGKQVTQQTFLDDDEPE